MIQSVTDRLETTVIPPPAMQPPETNCARAYLPQTLNLIQIDTEPQDTEGFANDCVGL